MSSAQARAFDRDCMDRLGIPGVVLMENAAIGLLGIAASMLGGVSGRRVEVICGSGNNGGDGYALARHLHVHGAMVRLRPVAPPRPGSDAAVMARICARMGLAHLPADAAEAFQGDLLVDAVLGTGLKDALGPALAAVLARFAGPAPVLAVDVPSGMDADTGAAAAATVRATVTGTMAAAKTGFSAPGAAAFTGRVVVVNLGCPPPLPSSAACTPSSWSADT